MVRIENGEWYGAAVVFDGEDSVLYVDGALVERLKSEKTTTVWLKPDEDGCRVTLRTTSEGE